MQPGERIAIKAAYTRKHGLPFDNRGHRVSVMRIKATGTIAENLNDGKRVRVDWTEQTPPREWYFHTNQNTVWRVLPSDWKKDNLIAFAFEEEPQDVTRFRNSPFWRDRFGDRPEEQRFLWTRFYEAVAERLLGYQNDRSPLIEGIHEIASRVELLSYLQDRDSPDGDPYPLKDICPFTAMGIFNRYVTDSNRRKIAAELARLLGVDVEVPGSFEGVPKVNNQNSWFFRYSYRREDGDVDALWDMFAAAGRFAGSDRPEHREAFIRAYETASNISGVRWNLSIGLYWTHPWDFPTLDGPVTQLHQGTSWGGPSGQQRRELRDADRRSERSVQRRKLSGPTAFRNCRWRRTKLRRRQASPASPPQPRRSPTRPGTTVRTIGVRGAFGTLLRSKAIRWTASSGTAVFWRRTKSKV